jgi:type I restriction enzyme S subunit
VLCFFVVHTQEKAGSKDCCPLCGSVFHYQRIKLMNTQNRVVSFLKSEDEFGGLSNLADGYPIQINGIRIPSSEHLYQALKFPDHPEIQASILKAGTPTEARKIALNLVPVGVNKSLVRRVNKQKFAVTAQIKPYSEDQKKALKEVHQSKIRADWDEVKLEVMNYCLRVKLINNWVGFGELLRSTGDTEIVQKAPRKESFWGLFTSKDGYCRCGYNHLGRLLVNLRDELIDQDNEPLRTLVPPVHLSLRLLGSEIESIDRKDHLRQVGTRFSEWVAEVRP